MGDTWGHCLTIPPGPSKLGSRAYNGCLASKDLLAAKVESLATEQVSQLGGTVGFLDEISEVDDLIDMKLKTMYVSE